MFLPKGCRRHMKNFRGIRVVFQKADLAHLDDGQLKIIAVFSHIMNRLKMLESLVYSHINVVQDETLEQARRDVAIGAFLEVMILMAGDLKEGWAAIQQCYYATKVSKTMTAVLPEQVRIALKRLPNHF